MGGEDSAHGMDCTGEGGSLCVKEGTVAFAGITVGAVCVYPARVPDAVNTLKAAGCNIPVASGKLYLKISQ